MSINVDGFYDARTARDIAVGGSATNQVVLNEINTLRLQVDTDAAAGRLEIQTDDQTPGVVTSFSSTQTVFEAWNQPDQFTDSPHKIARERMNRIINYFSSLGYSVRRERVGSSNTFCWRIKW